MVLRCTIIKRGFAVVGQKGVASVLSIAEVEYPPALFLNRLFEKENDFCGSSDNSRNIEHFLLNQAAY